MTATPPDGRPPATARVTYGGYGSNLHRPRLLAYVEGAPADGPFGPHRGSSDRRPPPPPGALVMLPGRLYFGGWSSRWGGGVAFVDLEAGGAFLCRPYDLSVQQLRDLVAQENGVAGDEALPADLGIGAEPLRVAGRYDLVATLVTAAGDPVRVVTSSRRLDAAAPSPAYLGVIAAGLLDAGTPREEVVGYLAASTRGLVDADDVEAAVPAEDDGTEPG